MADRDERAATGTRRGLGRRELLRRGAALGLAVPGIGSILAACGTSVAPAAASAQPAASPAGTAAAKDPAVTIRYAWTQPGQHVARQSAALAKRIEEFTGGSVKVQTFPDGTLYNDRNVIEPTQTGAVDMSDFPLARWVEVSPVTNLTEVPFAITDDKHIQRALDGGLRDLLVSEIEPKGVKLLGFMSLQASGILLTREKPLKLPADLKGLKMRMPSPVGVAMIQAWGAAGVVLGAADVYLSLQRGTIDGLLTTPSSVVNFKWNEVAKYGTVLVYQGAFLFNVVFNAAAWKKLTANQQAAIQRAVDVASATTFAESGADFEDGVAQTAKGGVQIYRIPSAELPNWQKPTASIRDDFIKSTGAVAQRAFDILDKTR